MMRQMQRKARRRGEMPLPPVRQAQVFGRVGKPLPTSFDQGAKLVEVRDRLGHSSIAVTSRYLHPVPGGQDSCLDALGRAMAA
jgi:hypothetical protein